MGTIKQIYSPSVKYILKGKGKVIPQHAMEAHGVRGGTDPTHF
jgi:hypothetical protein